MIKDVEPLLKECEETLAELKAMGEMNGACYVQGFINSINKLPSVEMPHGVWIIRTDKNGMHIYSVCSNCNVAHLDTDFPNFCENCGSDNRKRGEDRANN